MAADYWSSTQHRHWQFPHDELHDRRQKLEDEDRHLAQQFPLPERRHLSIFFNSQLAKLAKPMAVRQQALATAHVYIKRFYLSVPLRRTNPYLLLATSLYLACKMEECPLHIRVVVSEARNIWPDFILSDVSKLGEMEFCLIQEMNSQLIVHHPYRTLAELQEKMGMAAEEISLAASIINDHYLTDLPLLYPPHVVAVTAIVLAIGLIPTQVGLLHHPTTTAAGKGTLGIPAAVGSATSVASSRAIGTSGPSGASGASRASSVSGTSGTGGGAGAETVPGKDAGKLMSPKVQNLVTWLAEGDIDIKAVVDCAQELIALYQTWEQYSEKACKEGIARFVKARGLDK